MKRNKNIYSKFSIFCILTVLLSSCTEEINIPLDSTYTRLVVDGSITTDTTAHKVRLTKSGDALYKDPVQPVSNALVVITDGSNNFVLHENPDDKGVYETDPTVYGEPGKTYTLNISNVDIDNDGINEEYTASSAIHAINPIDSITVLYEGSNPDYAGWMINLYGREIGGGRNFYLMKALINDVMVTDSTNEFTYLSDNTGFVGQYYNGFPVYMLQKDKKDEVVNNGDKITLEMDGITEDYFNFINDYIQEYYPKIPIFSGPSANISTNIQPKDKAVGFFAAYSVQRASYIYKQKK